MSGELYWQADLRPVLEALDDPAQPDLSDATVLAALRDPGPPPPPVPGVTWSKTTIDNIAGDHRIPVRVYRPDEPDQPQEPRPAYLMFHGGGLSFGHLNTEHQRCVELTRSCGAVGVSVDYRMAPEHSAEVILDDAYSALHYVTTHAAALGVDPDRVALTGSSGGGMLTLSMAQLARDRGEFTPMLQLAFYPNTDNRSLARYRSRTTDYPAISVSAINQVMHNLVPSEPPPAYAVPNRTEDLTGLCPAFIVIGQNDTLRDEAVDYARRLLQAGVPTELHVLPGVSHAFDLLAPNAAATASTYQLMNAAFQRVATRS